MKNRIIIAWIGAASLMTGMVTAQEMHQETALSLIQIKDEMEKSTRKYEKKLKQLEERLEQAERDNEEVLEEIEQLAVDISQKSNQRNANRFNPGIGMVLNGRFVIAPDNSKFLIRGFFTGDEAGPGEPGFQLGESELSMASNVDDKFYASTTIAFGEATEVEEAYIQTLNLGNGLNIKAGRFFSGIGYLAEKHAHTDDFANRPLPYEVFLGGQLSGTGMQSTWIAPTAIFWESGIEMFLGDAFPADGAGNSGKGSWTAFSHIGGDLGDLHSWRAGLSRLNADVEERKVNSGSIFSGDSQLWIADFIYKWALTGNRGQQELKILGEYFQQDEQGLLGDTYFSGRASGWYLEGVYRFMRQWKVGVRTSRLRATRPFSLFDLEGNVFDSERHSPTQTSLMVEWDNSEFSRIRLQVDRNDLNGEQQNVWILQYIAAFGAHRAHNF